MIIRRLLHDVPKLANIWSLSSRDDGDNNDNDDDGNNDHADGDNNKKNDNNDEVYNDDHADNDIDFDDYDERFLIPVW